MKCEKEQLRQIVEYLEDSIGHCLNMHTGVGKGLSVHNELRSSKGKGSHVRETHLTL